MSVTSYTARATLKDYIPEGVKIGFLGLALLVVSAAMAEQLYLAWKTGVI